MNLQKAVSIMYKLNPKDISLSLEEIYELVENELKEEVEQLKEVIENTDPKTIYFNLRTSLPYFFGIKDEEPKKEIGFVYIKSHIQTTTESTITNTYLEMLNNLSHPNIMIIDSSPSYVPRSFARIIQHLYKKIKRIEIIKHKRIESYDIEEEKQRLMRNLGMFVEYSPSQSQEENFMHAYIIKYDARIDNMQKEQLKQIGKIDKKIVLYNATINTENYKLIVDKNFYI